MINLNQNLIKEIEQYCKLNDLDINVFVNDLLKKSFLLEKYGEKPDILLNKKTENKVQAEPKTNEVNKTTIQDKKPVKNEEKKVIPALNNRLRPRKPIGGDLYGE